MSEYFIVTDPVLGTSVSYGILIFFTAFLLWMENKRRAGLLSLRIFAVLLVVVALAGFIMQPKYSTTTSEQAILLTSGFRRSQADSILNLYPSMKVFHAAAARPFKSSGTSISRGDLTGKHVAFILGQGLPVDSLDMFALESYQFIPSAYPEGIIRLFIPPNIFPGRSHNIYGVYNNTSGIPVNLFLNGPGGKEDSAYISNKGYQHFKLSMVPKRPGNFLFSIQSHDSLQGQLPVRVEKHQPLDILFIQHYPSFETRHLKEFLSRHHRLVVRSQLSKSRFRYEYVNRDQRAIGRLTRQSLSEFDLVIIDTDALQALSSSDGNNLRSEIQAGLGMLPLFNTTPAKVNGLEPLVFRNYGSDTAHVHAGRNGKRILAAWPSKEISERAVIPVLQNKNRVLSGYRYHGIGKIGFQLLQQTYGLFLQGDSTAYSEVWTNLLEQISRSRKSGFNMHKKSGFPHFPDRPVALEIISSGERPAMSVNGIIIPLKENLLIDDLWEATFWADKPGWNTVLIGGDSPNADLYISDLSEWRSLAIANKIDETARRAGSALSEPKFQIMRFHVPLWIFYFLFLTGAGCLWLVPKL